MVMNGMTLGRDGEGDGKISGEVSTGDLASGWESGVAGKEGWPEGSNPGKRHLSSSAYSHVASVGEVLDQCTNTWAAALFPLFTILRSSTAVGSLGYSPGPSPRIGSSVERLTVPVALLS
ncbi:hypothetical protein CRG98_011785 [Punica granatum]|uniref:Uncharacterized protein n=1 Tax=Punica granatum TaxID=22663 RepID=A0A2I0KH12_PUNGR|nr:hypothetical protein CRG98_011785 [Punica granatum]